MPQLKVLSTIVIKPLPLFQVLGDRECPLDHVKMVDLLWVCTILVWVLAVVATMLAVTGDSCRGHGGMVLAV